MQTMTNHNTNKSKRELLNESFKREFVENAVPFLQKVYSKTKLGYIRLHANEICKEFKMPFEAVSALVDLKILYASGSMINRMYYWKNAQCVPTNTVLAHSLAEKVYNRIQEKKRVAKANKNLAQNQTNLAKARGLVPIIGSGKATQVSEEARVLRVILAIQHEAPTDLLAKDMAHIHRIAMNEIGNSLPFKERTAVADEIISACIHGTLMNSNDQLQTFYWRESDPDEQCAQFVIELIQEMKQRRKGNAVKIKVPGKEISAEKKKVIMEYLLELWKQRNNPMQFAGVKKNYGKWGLSSTWATVIKKAVLNEGAWFGNMPNTTLVAKICGDFTEYNRTHNNIKSVKKESTESKIETVEVKSNVESKQVEVFNHVKTGNKTAKEELEEMRLMVSKLNDKKTALLADLKAVDESISLGNDLIAKLEPVAFKENYERLMSKGETVKSSTPTAVVSQSGRMKHVHNVESVVKMIKEQGPLSTKQICDNFYPGTDSYNDKRVKALSKVISNLKLSGKILKDNANRYQVA